MDRAALIRDRLNAAFTPEKLQITDESHRHAGHAGAAGGGGHFSVKLVSEKFVNHPTLERHRMVYRAVDDLMPAEIHALSIQALTPEENNA
ncbi:MAG: BolA family protein [Gammaproteobacteria bacterium]